MRISPVASRIFAVQNLNSNNKVNNFMSTPLMGADSVNFKGDKPVVKDVNVDYETAKFVANSLSTSTSGHRAPYMGDKFTPEIVRLMTLGVADYAKKEAAKTGKEPIVMIGGDTRVATRESLPLIKDTLLKQGVNVLNIEKPVPTPLLAMAAQNYDVDIAVLMTASHNPWSDGGYNLVTKAAAIAPVDVTKQVAQGIEKYAKIGTYVEQPVKGEEVTIFPFEEYDEKITNSGLIDWENIKNSGVNIFYDALGGTGSYVMPDLLDKHGVNYVQYITPGLEGPNPNADNLADMGKYISDNASSLMTIGIANDGDADRFGIVDENGKFISPNDVLLLAAYHLANNKGKTGAIIRSQATSKQVDEIANAYGLPLVETPVGFKYIGEDIIDFRKEGKDILVAGEESGGLTVNGHIPEKDGIMATLLMVDLVATEGKPISKILEDVKKDLPKNYAVSKVEKKFTPERDADKDKILANAKNLLDEAVKGNTKLGDTHEIDPQKSLEQREEMFRYREGGDGVKLILTDGSTALFRKSGTEPLVKCYVEASGHDYESAKENADTIISDLSNVFNV